MHPARLRLGQLLVDARILTAEQLEEVLALQRTDGRKLGALLVESGLVTETLLTQVLSQQLSVPWVSLNHIDFSRELLNLIPLELAEKYCLVPIYVRVVRGQGDTLYVAMEDPMNEDALRDCAAASGLPARAMIAAPSDIFRVLRMHYGSTIGAVAATSAVVGAAPVAAASGAKAAVGGAPPVRAPAVPRVAPNGAGDTAPKPSRDGPTRPEGVPAVAAAAIAPAAPMAMASAAMASSAAPLAPVVPESQVNATGSADESAPNDDAPSIEASEVDLAQKRKRGRQLTLLDGTTIKLPTNAKKRAAGRRRSDPSPQHAPSHDEITAADVVAALRAAAHGVDSADMLGESLRWEKMMAAVLTLLLRKHLILERELLEELKKI
jgi:type IV pilus assembly protein PilB